MFWELKHARFRILHPNTVSLLQQENTETTLTSLDSHQIAFQKIILINPIADIVKNGGFLSTFVRGSFRFIV